MAPPPFLSSSPPLTCSTLRPRPWPGPRPPWRAPCPAPFPSLRLAGCRPPPHSAPPPVSCYPRAWRRPHAPTPGRPRRRSSPRAAGAAAAIVSAQTADSRTLWRWHSRFRVRSVVSGSARLFPDRVPGAAEVEVGVVPRDAEGVRVAAGLGSRLSRVARSRPPAPSPPGRPDGSGSAAVFPGVSQDSTTSCDAGPKPWRTRPPPPLRSAALPPQPGSRYSQALPSPPSTSAPPARAGSAF